MASPSISSFRSRFPEFGATAAQGASDALIQAAIDHAAEICDADIYGDRHEQAVLYTAADDLANSPFARNMKLVDPKGQTPYSARAKQLMRIAACGVRGFL